MSVRLTRRAFVESGLLLALAPGGAIASGGVRTATTRVSAWLRIAVDGTVTILVNSTDLGQGAQTGLAQLVAEELDAAWSSIRVEMAPVSAAYLVKGDDKKGYYTGGSSSIRPQFEYFRRLGAAARSMLVSAAAVQWKVPAAELTTRQGRVFHGASARSASFAELAPTAARRAPPAHIDLKARPQWQLIGQSLRRLDLPGKVDGSTRYGIDFQLHGLLTASVAHCPMFGGTLESLDDSAARGLRGFIRVLSFDAAVVVVAENFWSAQQALKALKIHWQPPADLAPDTAVLSENLRRNIGAADSATAPRGDAFGAARIRVDAAFAAAQQIVEGSFAAPLLSHSPLEPMNATARVSATRCELWAPMQDQGSMLDALAQALGLPPAAIILHTLPAGGGFGRRLQVDYGVLAAKVARAAGRPVKLIYSRSEDMQHGFYRPASITRLRAALDAEGRILAIDAAGATTNDVIFGGLSRLPYAIPEILVRQKEVRSAIPCGAWRSVDASIATFFVESLIDMIAVVTRVDAWQLRRQLLAGNPRDLRVLDLAAQRAGWGHPPVGRALGLAYFSGWGTRVAQVAEVSVSSGNKVRIHRITCVFDCGTAVNPDAVRAQVEGGILFGLSAALFESLGLRGGAVEQRNFDDYPVLRISDAPEIDVMLLESPDAEVGGVGEPPVPPVAPAVANAIFAATGRRLQSMPLTQRGVI